MQTKYISVPRLVHCNQAAPLTLKWVHSHDQAPAAVSTERPGRSQKNWTYQWARPTRDPKLQVYSKKEARHWNTDNGRRTSPSTLRSRKMTEPVNTWHSCWATGSKYVPSQERLLLYKDGLNGLAIQKNIPTHERRPWAEEQTLKWDKI